MYLVDTNVWVERLLDQERSEEVGRFLDQISSEILYISDFAFHSLGVIMTNLHREKELLQFVKDAFLDGAVTLVHLGVEDTERVVQVREQFDLDFDDAYQYSKKLSLQ